MTRLLQRAFEELATLPHDAQDHMGEQLLRWRQLRTSIEQARQNVLDGDVAPLDAEEIIRKARMRHAGS